MPPIVLPTANFVNNFWPLEVNNADEYLLKHTNVSNSFDPLVSYKYSESIYLRKIQDGTDNFTYSLARDLSHTYPCILPSRIQAKTLKDSLECLFTFSNSYIVYTQTVLIPDSPTLRLELENTGRYNNTDIYSKWNATDNWFVSEETHYKHSSVGYAGQPYNWEKNFVLAEQARRESLRNSRVPDSESSYTRGQPIPSEPVRLANTDFRSYRPIDTKHPELLPESLVDGLSKSQITLEDLVIKMITPMLKPEYPSYAAQTRAYESKEFPYTKAQVEADPMVSINLAIGQITTSPTEYITVEDYLIT